MAMCLIFGSEPTLTNETLLNEVPAHSFQAAANRAIQGLCDIAFLLETLSLERRATFASQLKRDKVLTVILRTLDELIFHLDEPTSNCSRIVLLHTSA